MLVAATAGMPRHPRFAPGGVIYHVFNRGVRRHTLFHSAREYSYFQRLMGVAGQRVPMRVLAYCLMPNHWHLVVWPEVDGAISAYFQWLTGNHARHFNATHGLTGQGHVYQGRFRHVPVENDSHLLALLAYVESNPVRARLVDRAEHWRWSSLTRSPHVALTASPCPRPAGWLEYLGSGTAKHLSSM